MNADWLRGELRGRSGIFPLNFVNFDNPQDLQKLIDENKSSTNSSNFQEKFSNLALNSNNRNKIVAAFDYNSGVSCDLIFHVGDEIEILDRHPGNQWITGRLKNSGQTGLVPLTYTHPPNC